MYHITPLQLVAFVIITCNEALYYSLIWGNRQRVLPNHFKGTGRSYNSITTHAQNERPKILRNLIMRNGDRGCALTTMSLVIKIGKGPDNQDCVHLHFRFYHKCLIRANIDRDTLPWPFQSTCLPHSAVKMKAVITKNMPPTIKIYFGVTSTLLMNTSNVRKLPYHQWCVYECECSSTA